MQKSCLLFLIAFLNFTTAFAELKANCSDENTFLKLNEIKINEAGERVAELFMNLKDLNRILNLPEVILQQHDNGILVSEANGNLAILLNFNEATELPAPAQIQEDTKKALADMANREVQISVKLEGQKVRENTKLKCEK